jgi:hypothetical protein
MSSSGMLHCVFLHSIRRLLVTANVVCRSPVLVTLMTEALHSSEYQSLQEPHSVTAQKTAFIIVDIVSTAVEILDLIRRFIMSGVTCALMTYSPAPTDREICLISL